MIKRERVNGDWILADACLRRRDLPTLATESRQVHRVKLTSRDLRAALERVLRPSQAEIEADEYDGRVPLLQWLGRGLRKYD